MSIGGGSNSCPLCGSTEKMGAQAKLLYGHLVCKKCHDTFASLRQAAFFLDFIFWAGVKYPLGFAVGMVGVVLGMTHDAIIGIASAVDLALIPFFLMKDGFVGRSPGKALLGLHVLDETTGQPAGFVASLRRNLALLIPIPFWWLLIGFDLHKGYRIGDGWSHTRVIWGKYKDAPPFQVQDQTGETSLAA